MRLALTVLIMFLVGLAVAIGFAAADIDRRAKECHGLYVRTWGERGPEWVCIDRAILTAGQPE